MNMYAQDYDEAFPQWFWDRDTIAGGGPYDNATSLWWNAMSPYVKNVQIFNCPDNNYNFTPGRMDTGAGSRAAPPSPMS